MPDARANITSELLRLDDSFNFYCGKDVECFNLCCRDINLYLTPYDILRIKRRLGMSSREFLKLYTLPLFSEQVGHPVILLKMIPDETRNCPFVSEDGCLIYSDRPWSCRSFPLEHISDSRYPEFTLIKRDFCTGFGRGKNYAIRKWRESQNVAVYEEINDEWKKVTHNEKFLSQNLLEGQARDIFFLGSYNVDEFRNLVFRSDFLRYFDIDKKTLKKIKSNETELLLFAFQWIRQVLFKENALKKT